MQSREEINRWNKLGKSFWSHRTQEQKWLHEYLLYPFISNLVGEIKGNNVLDFGCTDGLLVNYLFQHNSTNKQFFAYDRAKEMLHLAKQNIKQNGAVINTLGNRKFDIVIANMVFQDIYNLEDVLKMLKKHLTKNGFIIASFPNPLHSSEKGNSPTARHQFLNEGDSSGILIEKMFWSDD